MVKPHTPENSFTILSFNIKSYFLGPTQMWPSDLCSFPKIPHCAYLKANLHQQKTNTNKQVGSWISNFMKKITVMCQLSTNVFVCVVWISLYA